MSFPQFGCTPLITASRGGHTATVELLLANGAAVNQADDVSWSLHRESSFAIDLGLSSTEFLRQCPSLRLLPCSGVGTPLIKASYNGHTATVELLLAKGAAVNQADNVSWLLHMAMESSFAIVPFLSFPQIGTTPLNTAAYNGHTATLSLSGITSTRSTSKPIAASTL